MKVFTLLFPPKTPVENFEQILIDLTESKHPLTDIYNAWHDPGIRPDWHEYCKRQLARIDLEFYQAIEHFCEFWNKDIVTGNPLGVMVDNYRRFCEWKIKEEWLDSAFPKLAISLQLVDRYMDTLEEYYDIDLTEPSPDIRGTIMVYNEEINSQHKELS